MACREVCISAAELLAPVTRVLKSELAMTEAMDVERTVYPTATITKFNNFDGAVRAAETRAKQSHHACKPAVLLLHIAKHDAANAALT